MKVLETSQLVVYGIRYAFFCIIVGADSALKARIRIAILIIHMQYMQLFTDHVYACRSY